MQREQTTFAIADDSNLALRMLSLSEPVNGAKNPLQVVADHVPSHVERLPIDPLTVGHVGLFGASVISLQLVTADDGRDQQVEPLRGQPGGDLFFPAAGLRRVPAIVRALDRRPAR